MVKQPFLVEQSLRYLDETGDVKKYLQPNFFRQRRIQQRDQQEMDVGNWVDAWSTMQKGEVGRRSTSSYFGTVGDPIGRCRSSDRYRAGNTQSVRCKTYGTSAHSSRQARPQTAHSNSRRQNGVETKKPKPNVFIVLSQVVGEVGLALCQISAPNLLRSWAQGAQERVELSG